MNHSTNISRRAWFSGLLVAFIFIGVASYMLPLGTAIQFGSDEKFELAKGFFYSQHWNMIDRLWNDQPPLLSCLLGLLIKCVGSSLLGVRLLAIGFAFILCVSLFVAVSMWSGRWSAVLAILVLLAAPDNYVLMVSVMAEVPAFALGMASLALLLLWTRRRSLWLLLCSGFIFAAAIQIKYTAILLAPALFVELVCLSYAHARACSPAEANGSGDSPGVAQQSMALILLWIASLVFGLAALGALLPGTKVIEIVRSHLVSRQATPFQMLDIYRFNLAGHVSNCPEIIACAAIGFYICLIYGRWRAIRFPVIVFMVVLITHTFHRPWWWYYWFHFSIPLAMLAGVGFGPLLDAIKGLRAKRGARRLGFGSMVALLVVLVFSVGIPMSTRLRREHYWLCQSESTDRSPLLKEMLKYRQGTRWLYTMQTQYSFITGIALPPELAIMPSKRFITGQIDYAKVLEYLKEYRPEQILLSTGDELTLNWTKFLENDYARVYEDNWHALYIAKTLRSSVNGDRVDLKHDNPTMPGQAAN